MTESKSCTTSSSILMAKLSDTLFDAFDRNQDGMVDKVEFIAGVGLLVGVTRSNNTANTTTHSSGEMKFLFSLFDLNGDGKITLKEMTGYFSSMFNVLFVLDKNFHDQFITIEGKRYSAEEIGESTAINCFQHADKNEDGNVSFEEFKAWFTMPAGLFEQQKENSASTTYQESEGSKTESNKSKSKLRDTRAGSVTYTARYR
mmetsp:Transcript_5295/g.8883  ORF Transcript_5295/g.8883 Transcript_5295/m.8883 type:complete len:202 (+) Transcript_5295:94-699(+)